MRAAIWRFATRSIPEGCILPRWARLVRFVLYPLDTFYWWMGESRGYQLATDTWIIGGVRYASKSLHLLANSAGELYRISRRGDAVVVELVRHEV